MKLKKPLTALRKYVESQAKIHGCTLTQESLDRIVIVTLKLLELLKDVPENEFDELIINIEGESVELKRLGKDGYRA